MATPTIILREGETRLLTLNEVAEVLACSRSQVYKMAAEGVLESIQLPLTARGLRFRSADVLAIIEGRSIDGRP
jgi:excisionase family DNA binding protein